MNSQIDLYKSSIFFPNIILLIQQDKSFLLVYKLAIYGLNVCIRKEVKEKMKCTNQWLLKKLTLFTRISIQIQYFDVEKFIVSNFYGDEDEKK